MADIIAADANGYSPTLYPTQYSSDPEPYLSVPEVESALTGCARWHSIGPGQNRCGRQLSGILGLGFSAVANLGSLSSIPVLKSMWAFTPLMPKELVPVQQATSLEQTKVEHYAL